MSGSRGTAWPSPWLFTQNDPWERHWGGCVDQGERKPKPLLDLEPWPPCMVPGEGTRGSTLSSQPRVTNAADHSYDCIPQQDSKHFCFHFQGEEIGLRSLGELLTAEPRARTSSWTWKSVPLPAVSQAASSPKSAFTNRSKTTMQNTRAWNWK